MHWGTGMSRNADESSASSRSQAPAWERRWGRWTAYMGLAVFSRSHAPACLRAPHRQTWECIPSGSKACSPHFKIDPHASFWYFIGHLSYFRLIVVFGLQPDVHTSSGGPCDIVQKSFFPSKSRLGMRTVVSFFTGPMPPCLGRPNQGDSGGYQGPAGGGRGVVQGELCPAC